VRTSAAWICFVAAAITVGVAAPAHAQRVRITHGEEAAAVAAADEGPLNADGSPRGSGHSRDDASLLAPPRATLSAAPAPFDPTARVMWEITAAVATTAVVAAGAYGLGRLHETACLGPCELDPNVIIGVAGAVAATALVPLAVTLTGHAAGASGDYGDSLLGYITGLVFAGLLASLSSGSGGDAFIYPAVALAIVFPIGGTILAYEASTMPTRASNAPGAGAPLGAW
jgi:hypothetical protein